MSSNDYALSIAQKYRLAISMALLNTKPEDLTIDAYIDQIRNTISNDDNDEEDIAISICSDDFNMDSVDEVNDVETQNVYQMACGRGEVFGDNIASVDAQSDVRTEVYDVNNVRQDNAVHIQENVINWANDVRTQKKSRSQGTKVKTQVNNCQTQNMRTQSDNVQIQYDNAQIQVNDSLTEANSSRLQFNDKIQVDDNTQKSDNSIILQNYKETAYMDRNKVRRDMYREVMQVMKGVNATGEDAVNKQGLICNESSQAKPFDPMDFTQCYSSDSDQTFIERGVMNKENIVQNSNINFAVQKNDPNGRKESYALSQDNSERLNNIIFSRNLKETDILSEHPHFLIKEARNDGHLTETFTINQVNSNSEPTVDNMHQIVTCKAISENVGDKLTKVQYTQHNTHYSPSQAQITIDNRLIIGYNINHKINDGEDTFVEDREIFSENADVFMDSLNYLTSSNEMAIDLTCKENTQDNIETQTQSNLKDNCLPFSQDTDAREYVDTLTQTNIELCPPFLQDSMLHLATHNPIESLPASINFVENDTVLSKNQHTMEYENEDTFKPSFLNTKRVTNFGEKNDRKTDGTTGGSNNDVVNNDKCCTIINKPTDEANSMNIDFEKESLIPFKILEEINKIKSYLNKKSLTQSSLDSGYKSSQSKCSFKSSQPANASTIAESANSVFHYLCVCPLVTATQDLTDQMSEVLGLLIDRFHDDETYPPFLEELLNTVHTLLISLYEEDCGDVDVLTKKDEQTQRIVLLTKCWHIQKFAIEKINSFLQTLLDEPKETNHEIQNIAKINNLPYIFHVLQTLIPKYTVPSTSNTQEDEKTLRKKDISDLWRKKWIPNFKEISNEGTCEEICVIKECSAILNRMVVNFMEGYTLVAYCALKCFNMLQS